MQETVYHRSSFSGVEGMQKVGITLYSRAKNGVDRESPLH